MSGNVNPPTTVARLGTSGGPFCQAAHTGANQVNPATSARSPFRRRGVPRQITRPAATRASPAARLSAAPETELPAYVVARPGPSATASAPAPAASPNSPAAMRAGWPAAAAPVPSHDCGTAVVTLFPCWPQSLPEGSPDVAGHHHGLASMTTSGTLGGTRGKMTSRLATAALVGGLAVLGAGCAANAAAPACGRPSAAAAGSAAAGSTALPNP